MPPPSLGDVVLEACPARRSFSLAELVSESCKKPVKFPWETEDGSDGMWVMGPIGDGLLKKLREKKTYEPTSEVQQIRSPPRTPGTPRAKARRQACTATSSNCDRYDPSLYVPTSLCDNFEIANDLKPAARRLLEEASKETSPGIREIVPGIVADDLAINVEEPAQNGAPLFSDPDQSGKIVNFKIRKTRWQAEYQKSGVQGAKLVQTRLDRMEYACNQILLPELCAWCDQYRGIKAGAATDKAYKAAEQKELQRQRRIQVIGPRVGEVLLCGEEGERAAAALGKQAAQEVDEKIESAAEVCSCGYHEVWHEVGVDDRPSMTMSPLGRLMDASEPLAVKGPLDVEPPPPLLARSASATGTRPLISSVKQTSAVLSAGRLVLKGVPSLGSL